MTMSINVERAAHILRVGKEEATDLADAVGVANLDDVTVDELEEMSEMLIKDRDANGELSDAQIEAISIHTESMPLEVLIGLVSERVTHMELDWADGCCRAELKSSTSGRVEYVAWGRNAQVALARAMLAYDADSRSKVKRTVAFNKPGSR